MRNLLTVLILSLLSSFNIGCEQDLLGESGEVTFTDLTETPLDVFRERADGPVATNSTFRIRISEPGLDVADLTTSDENILRLVETRPIYGADDNAETVVATEVVTTVGNAGTVTLSVSLSDGRSDSIDIEAVDPSSSDITIFPNFSLFTFETEMWSENGIALLRDGEVQVFGRALDEKDELLMGAGGLEWTTSGAGLSLVDRDEENDFMRVKSAGELGMGSVRFGDSAPLEIETVSPDAVTSIALVRERFSANPASAGTDVYFHLALYTDTGRLVIGQSGEPAEFIPSEGLVVQTFENSEADADAERIIFGDLAGDGRNAGVRATEAGQYTLTVKWRDLETDVVIEVKTPSDEGAETE